MEIFIRLHVALRDRRAPHATSRGESADCAIASYSPMFFLSDTYIVCSRGDGSVKIQCERIDGDIDRQISGPLRQWHDDVYLRAKLASSTR